ncbi:Tn3 family transposase [Ensifer sp. 1H6]|uniref:Tn3 family transposase n=1 Tax=Ensifer sp. 1H6 TaxID=1911585 RepID=UPI000FE22CE5|nr:Tn3 family transposase [Ensifer sp. 1H6]
MANAFTHLRTGRSARQQACAAHRHLADGINLGLTRVADVSPGPTMRQPAWAHEWHIRVNAQRNLPLTAIWGTLMVLMAISGCIIALVETVFSRALKTSIDDVPPLKIGRAPRPT